MFLDFANISCKTGWHIRNERWSTIAGFCINFHFLAIVMITFWILKTFPFNYRCVHERVRKHKSESRYGFMSKHSYPVWSGACTELCIVLSGKHFQLRSLCESQYDDRYQLRHLSLLRQPLMSANRKYHRSTPGAAWKAISVIVIVQLAQKQDPSSRFYLYFCPVVP